MSEIVRDSLKKAVKGTAFVFGSTIISIGVWFLIRVLIVRNTTMDEMGLYSMAVAVASVVSIMATMGLQEGSTRYVSVFLGEGRDGDAARVGRTSMRFSLLSGAAASVLMYLLSDLAAGRIFYMPHLASALKAISPFPLFSVLMTVLIGVVRGYGDVRPRVYFQNLAQPFTLIVLVLLCVVFNVGYLWIVMSFAVAMVLASVGSLLYGRVVWNVRFLSLSPGGFGGRMLAFSLPLLAVAVIAMMFTWTDTLMIGRYLKAEDVAVYNAGSSMARLMAFPVSSLAFVFLPIAGDLYARKQTEELRRAFQVLTKWVFAGTFPFFFILFFFPEMCITFVFEQRYLAAAVPLSILSLGHLVNVFVGASGNILMAMGLSRELMKISMLVMLINILLNYVFLKVMGLGVLGAAWATTASFFFFGLFNTTVLYRRSGILPFTMNYIRPVLATGVVGLLIYVMAKSLPLSIWMLPVYLILFAAGYAASIVLTHSIDREDMEILESVLRRSGMEAPGLLRVLDRFVRRP